MKFRCELCKERAKYFKLKEKNKVDFRIYKEVGDFILKRNEEFILAIGKKHKLGIEEEEKLVVELVKNFKNIKFDKGKWKHTHLICYI